MRKISNFKFQILNSARNRAGFTLIEVLIVMGLVSILLVMGIMSMLSYIGKQNLESETRSIIALMRDAQSKSMAQQDDSRWGVYLSNEIAPTRDYYAIFQVDEALVASSSYTAIPGTTLERKSMRSNVQFESPAESDTTVILFTKISGLPSASTTVIIEKSSDTSDQKTIFISGNGKLDYQ